MCVHLVRVKFALGCDHDFQSNKKKEYTPGKEHILLDAVIRQKYPQQVFAFK